MKILFITLSNIGDVFLALPALDFLRSIFPQAKITVMAGDRPAEIFRDNPFVDKLLVFNKKAGLKEKMKLLLSLKRERFDFVIDLRNSLFGALLSAKHKIPLFLSIPQSIKHMSRVHLYKLQAAGLRLQPMSHELSPPQAGPPSAESMSSIHISPEDKRFVDDILKDNGIRGEDKIIIIAAGARSHIKRWSKEKFAQLIDIIGEETGAKILLVGDKDDIPVSRFISEHAKYPVLDLTAKTSLKQLAYLLKKARLLVTNDSAVLHIASYMDASVVAIFGPTDEKRYGPWSHDYAVVKKEISCRPCLKAQCRFGTVECMRLVRVEDAVAGVRNILAAGCKPQAASSKDKYKRILVVRTDRIGDVILSTPVIKALRDSNPNAYIAMMVSPYAKDIVEGNPYLDEAIIYDKDGKHRSWRRSLKFASRLKKKKFDLAIILHPANRAHVVTFFAAIPKRVGYDRKYRFLLTDRIKHIKQRGEKHELEYNFDLLRYLGIDSADKKLFIPVKCESEEWVEELFRQEGIKKNDRVLAINSGANCPSRVWMPERFAQVADILAGKYGFKVLIISGPKEMALAQAVASHMKTPAINLAGKTSLSQLASLIKRCRLVISNDSGPVHIAAALGVPVVSIFSRKQPGLNPTRWGPVGEKNKVLHKDVGCIQCLAHNCVKEFACLKAITVDEVLNAATSLID